MDRLTRRHKVHQPGIQIALSDGELCLKQCRQLFTGYISVRMAGFYLGHRWYSFFSLQWALGKIYARATRER